MPLSSFELALALKLQSRRSTSHNTNKMVLHPIEKVFRNLVVIPLTGKHVGFAEHHNRFYETDPRSPEEFNNTWYTTEETTVFRDETKSLAKEFLQSDPRAKALLELYLDFKNSQQTPLWGDPLQSSPIALGDDLLGLEMRLLPPAPRKMLVKQMQRYTSARHASVHRRMANISVIVARESRPSQIYARYCAVAAAAAVQV